MSGFCAFIKASMSLRWLCPPFLCLFASSQLETFQFKIRRLFSGRLLFAPAGLPKAKKTEICGQLMMRATSGRKAHRDLTIAQIKIKVNNKTSINGKPRPSMAIGQYFPAFTYGMKHVSRYTITNKILQAMKKRFVNLCKAPAII